MPGSEPGGSVLTVRRCRLRSIGGVRGAAGPAEPVCFPALSPTAISLVLPRSYTHRVKSGVCHGGNETRVISHPKKNFFHAAFPATARLWYGPHGEEPAPRGRTSRRGAVLRAGTPVGRATASEGGCPAPPRPPAKRVMGGDRTPRSWWELVGVWNPGRRRRAACERAAIASVPIAAGS